MALIHIDGFDHYGTDTARMTEGSYDQVDAAFTLSDANPRTGARCLRRDSSIVDSRVVKNFDSQKITVGSGLAISLSSLPNSDNSYAIAALIDSIGDDQLTLAVNMDGSLRALLGGIDGAEIAASATGVVNESRYQHIEFACIANTEDTDISYGVLEFSENFENGLDDYTLQKPQFYSLVSTPFGNGIKCTNVEVSTGNDSAFRSIPSNRYSRITFYATVDANAPGPDLTDADIAQFAFLNDTTPIISGELSRDATGTGSNERLRIQSTFIGSSKLTVGEWYFFEFDLNWDTGSFDYTVTGQTEGLFSNGTLAFFTNNPINALRFGVDIGVSERLNDAGTFADIEFFSPGAVIGVSNGIIEVRVDGVTVISESGIPTRLGDEASYNGITLNLGSSSSHGVTTDIDDWYIWDDQGAWNNSFLGDRRCYLLKPNQDTNIADFEPSSGSFGYKMIDDDSPDDDSTFIIAEAYLQTGSPLTGISEFEIESIPNGSSMISGLNVIARAAKTDNTSAEVYTSINSGGNSLSSAAKILTTSYSYYSDIYEYDPSTIASFTKEDIDNMSVSITADDMGQESVFDSPISDVVSPDIVTPTIPTDYIARYLFEDFTGNTAIDETGNYDGVVSGATVTTGPAGTDTAAAISNGNIITLDFNLIAALGSGAGTLSCAIRPHTDTNLKIILACGDTATTNNFLYLHLNSSDLRMRSNYNNSSIVVSDTSPANDTWHHVIFRTDGSTTSFRLNGSATGKTGTDTGAWYGDVSSPNNIIIGRLDRLSDVQTGSFDIAYLTLYNRELSDAECAALEAEY